MPLFQTIYKENTMNRFLLLCLSLPSLLLSLELPTEHAIQRAFGKSVELNSKVIQLSNAQQSIMSLVSGHIEKYFVEPGQKVKVGDKIALIESIMLSQMTAEYISLQEQYKAVEKNYKATKELYEKGMISLQDYNSQSIEKNIILAKITALKSQLETLGIDTTSLKKASADYILYAHSDGVVSELLQPLHSVIGEDTSIISIVKDQAYFIKSYVPLEYAAVLKVGQKTVMNYNGKNINAHVTQILPEVDEQTQRIIVLSSIDEKVNGLFINSYVPTTLYYDVKKPYVAVKKSALSFFQNEWVVFVPIEGEHHEEHDEHDEDKHKEHDHSEHEGHDHSSHEMDEKNTHDEHEKHNEHNEHTGHDEHEDEEQPYQPVVVEIITQDENYAAIKGLALGTEYVSDKSYYAKSMILKSSLGGHGH